MRTYLVCSLLADWLHSVGYGYLGDDDWFDGVRV